MPISTGRRTHWGDTHVSSRLRLMRTERGISQPKMAEALGVTVGQYHKYETGENRLTPGRIFDACAFLKIKPGVLFDGAGERQRSVQPEPSLLRKMEISDWDTLRAVLRLGPSAKKVVRQVAEELAKAAKGK